MDYRHEPIGFKGIQMKIVVVGKGGSGKSTVSALLAKKLENKGYRVIIIDADESNYGLHRLMGMNEPKELMELFGGKKEIGRKLLEAIGADHKIELFGTRWRIEEIPPECLVTKGGIMLMRIGKIKHFGEGCACPIGALSREFLANLDLNDNEVAIVDTEAGVEHIGRGVETGSDVVLMVVDPSYESLRLSGKVEEMLGEAKKPGYYVINKADKETLEYLSSKLDASKVVAAFGNEPRLCKAGLTGREVSSRISGAARLTDFVIQRMGV